MTPTYSVLASDPRFRAIVPAAGAFAATMDGSALLREWDRAGFRYLAREVAAALGAAVCVVKDPADSPELLREIAEYVRTSGSGGGPTSDLSNTNGLPADGGGLPW